MVRTKSVLLALALLLACAQLRSSPPVPTVSNEVLIKMPPCSGNTPAIRGVQTAEGNAPRTIYLNDYVTIVMCGMREYVAEARRQGKPMTLYIDYLDSGIEPIGMDERAGAIAFVFDRNETNTALIRDRLYDPFFQRRQEMRLSVARKGELPLSIAPKASNIVVFDKVYLTTATMGARLFIVGLLFALLWYGIRHDILREGPAIGAVRQPYSLARVQMAFWFVLIVIGYFGIWLVTKDRDVLPASLLGLMGISAATAVAAVAINSPAATRAAALRKSLDEQLLLTDDALQRIDADLVDTAKRLAEAKDAGRDPSALEELRLALERTRAGRELDRTKIVQRSAALGTVFRSNGLIRDLITNDSGVVALDRVQIIVWTAVLAYIFIESVVWNLTMPEFSGTLLALMGISSGTYIGFQLPQRGEKT